MDSRQNFTFNIAGPVGNLVTGGEHTWSSSSKTGKEIKLTSIKNVARATAHFVETEVYVKVKKLQQDKRVSVLHLYGMAGSGKSEIVLKLGENFPYNREKLFVKWHIECSDKMHDIKKQLAKLIDLMVASNLLNSSDGLIKSATTSMKQGNCQEFVDVLASINCPILIIIEDPSDDKFLEDFLRSIDDISGRENMIHVYITSKNKATCIQTKSGAFHTEKIEGFTVNEGLHFLGVDETWTENDRSAAKQIVEKLSGFPLGLCAVKMAKKPLSFLKIDPYMLLQQEKTKSGQKKLLYQTILSQLNPEQNNQNDKEGQNEQDKCHWQAMCMLSLVHHGNIPKILVERVMQSIRKQDVETILDEEDIQKAKMINETEANEFIGKFSDCGFCKEENTNQNEKRVTFHAVVFGAVKWHLHQQKELLQTTTRSMVTCIAAIVHKDLRLTKNHEFMIDMIPHLKALLDTEAVSKKGGIHIVQFCYAHLHEVLGSALGKQTSQAIEAEKHLELSLRTWFKIMKRLKGDDILYNPVTTFLRDGIQEKAKLIVEHCAEAGRILMSTDFDIERYISIVLQPRADEVGFYGQKSNEEVKSYLKAILEAIQPLNPAKLRKFRDLNVPLFMEKTKLFETLIAERIASVLHTMSLLIKSYRGNITPTIGQKSKDYATLAVAISEEVYTRFKVAPLFLVLSARGSVRVKLTALKLIPSSQKREVVLEIKRFIEENQMEDRIQQMSFYEHGICKQISTKEFDYLRHQRELTRINTKLIALGPNEDFNLEEADRQCQSLYEKAIRRKQWKISIRCIVYCGKYWASRGEFAKAAEHFEVALECKGIHSTAEAAMAFPWACYNHARAVLCYKITDRATKSKALCEQALKMQEYISNDLQKHLEDSLEDLNQMISPTKPTV